jgi:hypothetical protein
MFSEKVSLLKIEIASHFGQIWPALSMWVKYIYTFLFGSSHEIDKIALFTTRWRRVSKLIMPKFFPSKSYPSKYICRLLSCSSTVLTALNKNCIQIMHFRSDEKFLELSKILKIKNKGNYRGSVPIFRRPK